MTYLDASPELKELYNELSGAGSREAKLAFRAKWCNNVIEGLIEKMKRYQDVKESWGQYMILADRGLGAATPSRVGAQAKAKSKQPVNRWDERANAKAKSKSNAKTPSLSKAGDDDGKTKLPRLIKVAKGHLGQAVLTRRIEEFLQDVREHIE